MKPQPLYTGDGRDGGDALHVQGLAEAVGDGSVEAGDGCRRVEFYGGEVAAACPPTGVDHIDVFMNGGDDLVPAGSTL